MVHCTTVKWDVLGHSSIQPLEQTPTCIKWWHMASWCFWCLSEVVGICTNSETRVGAWNLTHQIQSGRVPNKTCHMMCVIVGRDCWNAIMRPLGFICNMLIVMCHLSNTWLTDCVKECTGCGVGRATGAINQFIAVWRCVSFSGMFEPWCCLNPPGMWWFESTSSSSPLHLHDTLLALRLSLAVLVLAWELKLFLCQIVLHVNLCLIDWINGFF